jgi:hypothetical protein
VGEGSDSREKGGGGWRTKVQRKRAKATERFVGDRVMRKTDALGERGTCQVLCRGEELHAPVPKSPPTLDFTIALCVVPTGGGVLGTGGFQHSSEQSREKLGCGIGVDDVR